MNQLQTVYKALSACNNALLAVARWIGLVAITVMVIAILVQVFFRYALNNALPWPDELARFCMLWMTGLMAPVAYRSGGFVAIDMLAEFLGKRAGAILNILLYLLSLAVLVVGIKVGYKHVTSGLIFSSASLRLPLELIGMQGMKLKLVYMYASLWLGLILLTLVNIELILKSFLSLFRPDEDTLSTPEQARMD